MQVYFRVNVHIINLGLMSILLTITGPLACVYVGVGYRTNIHDERSKEVWVGSSNLTIVKFIHLYSCVFMQKAEADKQTDTDRQICRQTHRHARSHRDRAQTKWEIWILDRQTERKRHINKTDRKEHT